MVDVVYSSILCLSCLTAGRKVRVLNEGGKEGGREGGREGRREGGRRSHRSYDPHAQKQLPTVSSAGPPLNLINMLHSHPTSASQGDR